MFRNILITPCLDLKTYLAAVGKKILKFNLKKGISSTFIIPCKANSSFYI
jgi:hypothetical protein